RPALRQAQLSPMVGGMSEPNDESRREAPAALAHDVWRQQRQPLEHFFAPRNVAVIGASEAPGSVGRTLLWNLISTPFGGTVFPVNPHRTSVMGIKAYATVEEVPARVDLAVIATPAETVPSIVS